MPRPKKQHLKQRADKRYCAVYHGIQFMGKDEDEALGKRDDYIRQLKAGEYRRENPTLQEYADKWIKISKVGIRETSLKKNKIHLAHLCNVIGEMYLQDVRPSDIKRVYSTHYKEASKSYISHARSLYTALFGSAVEDGIIRTNPVKSEAAKPHKGKSGSHRAITEEERNLIETVALDLPASVVARVMLYTGLRPQEVKALSVDDIDFENKIIHVKNFVHVKGSNSYSTDETGKTQKATRDIPLFPPVENVLKGKKGYIISNHGELVTPSVWDNEWRTYRNAIERHLNGLQKRWYGRTREHKELLKSGSTLPQWREFTVVPYDLRHSFVTWCRDNGVELHTCVEWMGHRDATMIMHIYDNPTDRSKIEAEKLTKKLFKYAEPYAKEKSSEKMPDITEENKDTHINS